MVRRFICAAAAASFMLASPAGAATADEDAMGFTDFVANLHAAPRSADPRFEEARAHLLRLYDGIEVRQTFVQDGQVLDCIRYDQQPAIRLGTVKAIAAPPAVSPRVALHQPAPLVDVQMAPPDGPDCAAGTFPLQRLTLARIMQAGSLRNYFQKGPGTAGQVHLPADTTPRDQNGHAYAVAFQTVFNHGGTSVESVYDPAINTKAGQVFSLEQQWYTTGDGQRTKVQTAEVGWQVFPGHYNTTKPVLFAYYTSDTYKSTGCYNLDCGAFVVSPGAKPVPGTQLSSSVAGGAQVALTIGYYLHGGNWWLSANGQWVGYYPTSLYKGGTMSHNADWFSVGTESYADRVGPTKTANWPAEGSGKFASAGVGQAAIERNIFLKDLKGNTSKPNMKPNTNATSACYTQSAPAVSASFGYYILFGGPGDNNC